MPGPLSKGYVASTDRSNKLIGKKRKELLKGVTIEIMKPDLKLMEAEVAFGRDRRKVAARVSKEIGKIRSSNR